ncbi:MAG TPA: uroporphyrinogen decarboxylase [Thermoplasmataceae archaeon]|nr:uroporphyrinogen decarboxylase [Thermoplasmatales archaeon AK]HLH86519.1 uroporphyrinogen decarboxylase [Thermoplasmataceae archaeon]
MYLLERALRGLDHDRIPVWFMRQAGRYSEHYRNYRSRYTFKEMCRDPKIVADITIDPVRRLGVDAAIIFSDIILPVESMGFNVEFLENIGPTVSNPFSSAGTFHDFDPSGFPYPLEQAIGIVRDMAPEVPVIGFAGGPITVASYLTEGRPDSDLRRTKKYIIKGDRGFAELLQGVSEMTVKMSKMQLRAGCSAIQIFDSWAGNLSTHQLREYSDRYLSEISSELSGENVIYFSTQTGGNISVLRLSGFHFFSLDWRTDLGLASDILGEDAGVQGNLDPQVPAVSKDRSLLETELILREMKGKSRYIFNLGHGVLPDTPEENLKAIVEAVHQEVIP